MRRVSVLVLVLVLFLPVAARADVLTPFGASRSRRILTPPANAVALRVQTGSGHGRLILPRSLLRRARPVAALPAASVVLCAGLPLLGVGLVRRPRILAALVLLVVLGPGLLLVQANPVVPASARPLPQSPPPNPPPRLPLLQVDRVTLELVDEGFGIQIVLPGASVARLAGQ